VSHEAFSAECIRYGLGHLNDFIFYFQRGLAMAFVMICMTLLILTIFVDLFLQRASALDLFQLSRKIKERKILYDTMRGKEGRNRNQLAVFTSCMMRYHFVTI
jgi:hypothetical protein